MSKSSVDRPHRPAVHLFKSLKDAHAVLLADRASGALSGSEELDALFERVEQLLRRLEGGDGLAVAADTFVVSVEGLDGSGKSSLVRGLEADIEGAVAFHTPPSSIAPLRRLFDNSDTSERTSRAFYSVTNYLALEEIQELRPRLAILDRYYHSTCAYSVSSLTLSELYKADREVFEWPHDLPRPNLSLQLQGYFVQL